MLLCFLFVRWQLRLRQRLRVHGQQQLLRVMRPGQGDGGTAVATLVGNYTRFLAFLERRVGSREVAEDILQDAFVRTVEHAAAVPDESATTWFYRVLRNALTDHYRRRGAEQRAHERVAAIAEGPEPPLDAELWNEVCACVGELVETLKPEYADALRRVDVEGAAVRDYAAERGITPGNAGVRLHRARGALRRQVERACGTCAEHGCLDCPCKGRGESHCA
jgi:RNA polymerase sigma-70 factor (ECF subfamily)